MKKGVEKMHFNADDSSVLMMMDLISSANDFCIVVGICESRRNTASVVLPPRVSRTSLSLDLDLMQLTISHVVLR